MSYDTFAAAPVEESRRDFERETTPDSGRFDLPPIEPTDSSDQSYDQAQPATGDGRLTDLFYQIQLLQDEVAALRGQVEEQAFRIERMSREQGARYAEMDRRITEVRGGTIAVAPAAPPTGAIGQGSGQQTERGSYRAAFGLVQSKQFDQAISAFDSLIVDYPNGQFTPNAFYWLGELYLAKDDLENARQNFVQIVTLYPDHAKVADALYKLGTVYHQLGDNSRALEYLDRVVREHPSGTAAGLARSYAQELR